MTTRTRDLMARFFPSRVDEQELIEALSAHAGLMISAAARVLGDVAEAEDVAQDIAEKLLRKRPAEVRSWPALLKKMAVNRAIDQLRRRRDPSQLPVDLTLPEEPDEQLVQRQRAEALRTAVAGLSERDATLFSLQCFADLDQAEIGRELGMNANAVGVALHRLRKRLSEDLSQLLDAAPQTTGEAQ
ncbi:MAG: sigma-70 family RNA polymerase sigma factor [Pseudomonadota bacterium]